MSVEDSSSDDSDSELIPPRFTIAQENSLFQKTDKLNLKFNQNKIFDLLDVQQYQSAPAERKSNAAEISDRSGSSNLEEEK